jgi:hypothetical protein
MFAVLVMLATSRRPSEACSSPRRPIFALYDRAETAAIVNDTQRVPLATISVCDCGEQV